MGRLGIITGLAFEADILRKAARLLAPESQPLVAAAGGDGTRAESLAHAFIDEGVSGLVSFGLCGALNPELETGEFVIARSVHRTDAPPIHTDDDWREAAVKLIPPWRQYRLGNFLETHVIIDRVDTKARLRSDGADAVDMESYGVAYAAKQAEMPFLGLRAVVDRAGQALPKAAVIAMKRDGTVNGRGLTRSLFHNPSQIGPVARLAHQSACARKGLRDLAFAGLPLFGLVR